MHVITKYDGSVIWAEVYNRISFKNCDITNKYIEYTFFKYYKFNFKRIIGLNMEIVL